jgi:hypothetical protein
VPDPSTYDYAVIRVVPRVEREEFVNVGVVVSCPAIDFLDAAIEVDRARIAMLDPSLDIDTLERHLASIRRICRGGADAGPIGQLSRRERFRWMVAPRSTVIQFSPAHTGRCDDPGKLLDRLMGQLVRVPQREDANGSRADFLR